MKKNNNVTSQQRVSVDYNIRNRPIHNTKQIGRNDKCWCGSEIKYKKCCLTKDQLHGEVYDALIYRIDLVKYYEQKRIGKIKQSEILNENS